MFPFLQTSFLSYGANNIYKRINFFCFIFYEFVEKPATFIIFDSVCNRSGWVWPAQNWQDLGVIHTHKKKGLPQIDKITFEHGPSSTQASNGFEPQLE